MEPVFYIPDITGNTVALDPSESRHAVKVLRLSEGNRIRVVDGKGGFYAAEITAANPKKCRLSVRPAGKEGVDKDYRIKIAIAPTKNISRFEWFLEKSTELGIDEITPVLTAHSERKTINPHRLEKILIAAMKQSQKALLPQLNELISFEQFITQNFTGEKFIAHCNRENLLHLKNAVKKKSDVMVLIGPEGGFHPEEIEQAASNGWTEITLGPSRLRTETAGVAACHIVNLINS